jgi:hypothetical protein
VVKVNGEDTVWKRSRNKWNSFDKIRSFSNINNDRFDLYVDSIGYNSFYVIERMYYYLDKEKHKNRYKNLRAKLYITRVNQNKDWIFLLQFITEHLAGDTTDSTKKVKQRKKYSSIGDFVCFDRTYQYFQKEERSSDDDRKYIDLTPKRNNYIQLHQNPMLYERNDKHIFLPTFMFNNNHSISKLPPLSPSIYLKDQNHVNSEINRKRKYEENEHENNSNKKRMTSYGNKGKIIEDEKF